MHLGNKAASLSLASLCNMCIYQERFVGAYRLLSSLVWAIKRLNCRISM